MMGGFVSAAEPPRGKTGRPGGKIRFGVSGLGGRGLNWIGMLAGFDDVEVVAACDVTPASVVPPSTSSPA